MKKPRDYFALPDVINPIDYWCVTVKIPKDLAYLKAFWGVMFDLTQWINWKPDADHKAAQAASVMRQIFADLQIEECTGVIPVTISEGMEIDSMAFLTDIQEIDGKCTFVYRCCIDDPWIPVATVADLAKITQPGAGASQPQPGGGTQTTCTSLFANNQLRLTYYVNSGDTIAIESANGSGNDGGEAPWRCPDGNQFEASFCINATVTDDGDPVPRAPHMSLIAQINGTWYPFYPGAVITVEGGIVNQPVTIQVNDSDISNNKGSYDVCVKVTNNTTPTWQQAFFSGSGNGGPSPKPFWSPFVFDDALATYNPSVDKWSGTRENPGSGSVGDVGLGVQIVIPSGSTVTRVVASLSTDSTRADSGGSPTIHTVDIGGTVLASHNISQTFIGVDNFVLDSGVVSYPGAATISVKSDIRGTPGTPVNDLIGVVIYGTGTNPFA